jgi:hypothetical protein
VAKHYRHNGQYIWPVGRLAEVQAVPDADLLAYTVQGYDVKLTRYASRAALEAFCKDGSTHHAVVKAPVDPNMMTNRNVQRPSR